MSTPLSRPSYAAVLRVPHARRTFTAALTARLSYGMVSLAVLLSVTHATGSYTVSGTVLSLFGATTVFLMPLRASLIDRHGPRRVLPPMSALYGVLLSVLAVLTWRPGAPAAAVGLTAALAGSCAPPLGPTMRALWSELVTDRDLLRRAYSLDGVAEELLYVSGPALIALLGGFAPPAAGILLSAALNAGGTCAFVTSPAMTAQRRTPREEGSAGVRPAGEGPADEGPAGEPADGERSPRAKTAWQEPAGEGAAKGGAAGVRATGESPARAEPAGALAAGERPDGEEGAGAASASGLPVEAQPVREPAGLVRGLLPPVVVALGAGLALSAVELLVMAFATERSYDPALVPWVLGALSAGSALGGLANGVVRWRTSARTRLCRFGVCLGLVLAAAGLAPDLWTLTAAMACAGAFIAPALTTAYLLADESAPESARTRAGAWVNMAVNAGSSGGAMAAGLLIGRLPLPLCFTLAGGTALVAAVAAGGRVTGTTARAGAAASRQRRAA
ncbi:MULTISPECIES: MFS transporter, partial [unclassified Streptomyces]|uniref:MFS transporter n=1 Tax=unclassified Streptomyces TaxID=2593676 RepID=UPI0004CBF72A